MTLTVHILFFKKIQDLPCEEVSEDLLEKSQCEEILNQICPPQYTAIKEEEVFKRVSFYNPWFIFQTVTTAGWDSVITKGEMNCDLRSDLTIYESTTAGQPLQPSNDLFSTLSPFETFCFSFVSFKACCMGRSSGWNKRIYWRFVLFFFLVKGI